MLKFYYVIFLFLFSFSFCNAFDENDEKLSSQHAPIKTPQTESIEKQPSWNYRSIAKTAFLTGGSLGLVCYFFYKKQPAPAKIFASLAGLSFLHDLISNLFPFSKTQPPATINKQSHHSLNNRENTAANSSNAFSHIIEFGDRTLVVPSIMTITTDPQGHQLVTLPQICYMIVFEEVASAIKDNKDVRALHSSERSRATSIQDLQEKFNTVYQDMRINAGLNHSESNVEELIRSIQGFVDQMTQGSVEIPVKLERGRESHASRILIVKEARALFIYTQPVPKDAQ